MLFHLFPSEAQCATVNALVATHVVEVHVPVYEHTDLELKANKKVNRSVQGQYAAFCTAICLSLLF